ncbi:unnamed protein product [Periconia digitata]|uniref:Uncharacterized protein n=1 Tax=Periconia digitata TaxID=1303443 RepID=A0A9W4XV96_9PLEO|nr:unnamed protein product [Periconia digitata]
MQACMHACHAEPQSQSATESPRAIQYLHMSMATWPFGAESLQRHDVCCVCRPVGQAIPCSSNVLYCAAYLQYSTCAGLGSLRTGPPSPPWGRRRRDKGLQSLFLFHAPLIKTHLTPPSPLFPQPVRHDDFH